jgi:uncharacterized protein YbjT (DUF2867 family)
MPTPRTALLVGATGLVGGHLLDLVLANPAYGHLTALVRRPLSRTADKLTQRVVDFEHLPESSGDWQADDVFLCLGTTIAVAGSQEKFRRVDHDYTVETARLARDRGAARLGLISSVGAAEGVSSFYLRVKGETERDVSALGYESVEVFRPSLLVGDRTEKRRGEAAGIAVTRAVSWAMVGGLRAYRPIQAERVAAAMVRAVLQAKPGRHVHSYDELISLSS